MHWNKKKISSWIHLQDVDGIHIYVPIQNTRIFIYLSIFKISSGFSLVHTSDNCLALFPGNTGPSPYSSLYSRSHYVCCVKLHRGSRRAFICHRAGFYVYQTKGKFHLYVLFIISIIYIEYCFIFILNLIPILEKNCLVLIESYGLNTIHKMIHKTYNVTILVK